MSNRMNVGKGDRSRLVSQAVLHSLETHSKATLRQQLKKAALANASLDLEIATEWFPVEQEAWQNLEQAERGQNAFPQSEEIYLTALHPTPGHEIKKTRPALVIQIPPYPNEAIVQPGINRLLYLIRQLS